jgi:hypothetical protein
VGAYELLARVRFLLVPLGYDPSSAHRRWEEVRAQG